MSDDVSVGTDSRVNYLHRHTHTHAPTHAVASILRSTTHNPQPVSAPSLLPLENLFHPHCSKIGGQNREERLRPNMANFVL